MFLQFAPGALKLTPDQVTLLRSDNVVSDAAKAAGLRWKVWHRGGFTGSGRAQYLCASRCRQFQKKNA